jgi:hypothetical protein
MSRSAIQVKNWQKTIGIEEKLHVISRLEKHEQIVYMCHDVKLAHSSVCTIHDNADSIKENAECLYKARLPQSYQNEPFQTLWM